MLFNSLTFVVFFAVLLAGFDCPEWSHLTAADAVEWTEALMPLLEESLAGI